MLLAARFLMGLSALILLGMALVLAVIDAGPSDGGAAMLGSMLALGLVPVGGVCAILGALVWAGALFGIIAPPWQRLAG